MKKFFQLVVIFSMMVLLTSCNRMGRTPEALPANIQIGDTYYTQFALQFEKGHFITTNYRIGVLLPINSKVTLLDINRKVIKVHLEDFGHDLLIKNAAKHVGGDAFYYFGKLFDRQKVNLNKFTKKERANIKKGKVAVGMRKDAVIAAIGYPPTHQTPSLEYNNWTYWKTRWGDKFIVYFKNGRVTRIQD
jgi:hypothetical protein